MPMYIEGVVVQFFAQASRWFRSSIMFDDAVAGLHTLSRVPRVLARCLDYTMPVVLAG